MNDGRSQLTYDSSTFFCPAAVCLGRPFRLLVSKRRTVAVNWLLILLASSVAIRAATLVTLGYFVADAPTQRQCDERTADLKLCGLVVAKRLLEVLISLLYFVGASRMLPHMGYAAHARAFLAGGERCRRDKTDSEDVFLRD